MDSSDLRNQLDQTKEDSTTNEDTEQPEDNEPESVVAERPEDAEPVEETEIDDTVANPETTDENGGDDQGEAGGPAFTTHESDKISIYPHTDTSRLIKVLCNSVENDLLALGHDDFEVREAHDAMVRLANEHPREVTQLVLEARDLDPDTVEDLP